MQLERGIAFLTAREMADADRSAIEDYGIDVLSLMENAGRATAELARQLIGGDVVGRKICCLVGKGNNGGDGLAAARTLHCWGGEVTVVLGGERSEFRDVPARQLAAIDKMGIGTIGPDGGFGGAELLVDALLGYGSRGNPREPLAGLIRRANASGIPVLAVDVPSGLDASTGEPGDPCIAATTTVTFGFPKSGFLNLRARPLVGELYLADISFPGEVYGRYSMRPKIFGKSGMVKIR